MVICRYLRKAVLANKESRLPIIKKAMTNALNDMMI